MIVLQAGGFVILFVLAYLVGAIPFGVIVGKVFYGVDVRQHGSGNVGTTNVFRVLGKKAGVVVMIADVLKGCIPALIAVSLFGPWPGIIIAAAPEVGHMYSIFLKGSGGKGVATGAGIVLALVPAIFLICLLVWIAVILTTRYVSLASLVAAVLVPLLTLLLSEPAAYKIAGVLVTLIIFWAHRSNISRLLKGTEHRASLSWTHSGQASDQHHGRYQL